MTALRREMARRGRAGARMASRHARARQRGQTLIIFTLAFTALVAILGLAIDSVRVYNLYAQMLRAAEAGALAGVIYMPNNYLTNLPNTPFDNAVCRTLQETSKDGYGTYCNPLSQPSGLSGLCPASPASIEISVCPVTGLPHDLRVYITESINTTFISALGVGPLTITAVAQAEYIPPVNVAVDPGATGGTGSWGTFGECSGASSACTGNGSRNWAGNINGPGELKEQGDPLVTCEEGPSALDPAQPNGSIDTNAASSTPYTTYTDMPTNHPQYNDGASECSTSNPDQQNVFTGPSYWNGAVGPQHVGYAFYVHIPATDSNGNPNQAQNLWVWNAPFSPTATGSCNGRAGGQNQTSYDTFYYYNCGGSSSSPYPRYPHTSCSGQSPYTCLDPKLFFSVTYSIYAISGPTDPAGTLVGSFTATPYEVSDHGCNFWAPTSLSAVYLLKAPSGCYSSSNCVTQWCPVANQLGDQGALWSGVSLPANQDYRVMVVASDFGEPSDWNAGYGGHSYSLKLCPVGTTQGSVQTCTPAGNATLSGWTLSDALFSFPGKGGGKSQITEYPLGYAGSEFAGRTLDVQLYDGGDLAGTNGSASGNTVYAIAPPIPALVGTKNYDPCVIKASDLTGAGYPTSSFSFPNNERTNSSLLSPFTGTWLASSGDLIYNGLWTDEQIKIPSNYTGGNWTICAIAPQTIDADVLGIKAESLGASPVHLV
jgi:hypothetical protein